MNRILSKSIKAKRTQPEFNTSAMDGYAIRKSFLKDLPKDFNIIGDFVFFIQASQEYQIGYIQEPLIDQPVYGFGSNLSYIHHHCFLFLQNFDL